MDEPRFHQHLSGRENLAMLASSREPAASDRIDPALDRVGLGRRAEDKVGGYSMGMRQRLGVAACLLGDPELLILDEPMNGLDPAGMSDMREMILSFVDEGRTVVLSSHLLDEVQRTCDSVAIVDRGTVIRQGPIAELLAGTSVVLEVECSEPERATTAHRACGARRVRRPRPVRSQRHASSRDGPGPDRGDQPCARRGRDRPLSDPAAASFAGVMVPGSHQSIGEPHHDDGDRDAESRSARLSGPAASEDHRGSWVPSGRMIAARFHELRKRRGLMLLLAGVTVGLPTVYLADPTDPPRRRPPTPTGPPADTTCTSGWWPASCTCSASSWPPPWGRRRARST